MRNSMVIEVEIKPLPFATGVDSTAFRVNVDRGGRVEELLKAIMARRPEWQEQRKELFYGGKQLKPGMMIADCGLHKECTVHLRRHPPQAQGVHRPSGKSATNGEASETSSDSDDGDGESDHMTKDAVV